MTTGVGIQLFGDWERARATVNTMVGKYQLALKKSTLQEAHFLRAKMIDYIKTSGDGAMKPLAASTLAVRRFKGKNGTKPLIVTGGLRNSITVKWIGTETAFIGVLASAEQGRVKIAEIAENGITIVMPYTPKAHRFLMAAFRNAGLAGEYSGASRTSIVVIRIPPRPIMAPVIEKYAKPEMVKARFQKNLALNMGGILGSAV